MATDKYEEFYEFARWQVEQEQGRFERTDTKAVSYLGVVTLLIGGYAFVGQRFVQRMPDGFCDWLLLAVSLVVLLVLLWTFFELFAVLKVHALRCQNVGPSVPQFFQGNSPATIHFAYGKALLEDARIDRETTDQKSRRLARAYRWIFVSVVAILVQFAALLFCQWFDLKIEVRRTMPYVANPQPE